MATVAFTSHLRHYAPAGPVPAPGATVMEALASVITDHPRLKAYIFDDQDRLRKHVTIFLNGTLLPGAEALTTPVTATSEIYVMQALSGG